LEVFYVMTLAGRIFCLSPTVFESPSQASSHEDVLPREALRSQVGLDLAEEERVEGEAVEEAEGRLVPLALSAAFLPLPLQHAVKQLVFESHPGRLFYQPDFATDSG
jgi:hypothetical protein